MLTRASAATAIAAVGLVCATAPATASAAPGGPFAMHSMLQLNSPRPFKEAMFAAAAAAGASEIRVDASLGALNNPWIESDMWQGLQDYMQLSQQYGLPVLLDFNSSNDVSLETCPAGADPANGDCAVTNLAGYYNEIAAVVAYTRGVIDDFEIVNEPDGTWTFAGTPQQYAGMLRTAYDAVHATDPAGRVVLGGIMNPSDTTWLTEVFATPGEDAAHAFDVANVHLRDTLANLPGEMLAWRRYFAFFGDVNLPLWVTETGYPADPAYQYDPNFKGTDPTSGAAEQAAYLARELPLLVDDGAARVFVTERDNLGGQFASEGLLTGGVSDANEDDPNPVPRLSYRVFALLCVEFANAVIPAPPPLLAPAPAPAPTAHVTAAPAHSLGTAARAKRTSPLAAHARRRPTHARRRPTHAR